MGRPAADSPELYLPEVQRQQRRTTHYHQVVVRFQQKQLQPTGFHCSHWNGAASSSSSARLPLWPWPSCWHETSAHAHRAGSSPQRGKCQLPVMWEAVLLPRSQAAAASPQFQFLDAASQTTRDDPHHPKCSFLDASRNSSRYSGTVSSNELVARRLSDLRRIHATRSSSDHNTPRRGQ